MRGRGLWEALEGGVDGPGEDDGEPVVGVVFGASGTRDQDEEARRQLDLGARLLVGVLGGEDEVGDDGLQAQDLRRQPAGEGGEEGPLGRGVVAGEEGAEDVADEGVGVPGLGGGEDEGNRGRQREGEHVLGGVGPGGVVQGAAGGEGVPGAAEGEDAAEGEELEGEAELAVVLLLGGEGLPGQREGLAEGDGAVGGQERGEGEGEEADGHGGESAEEER